MAGTPERYWPQEQWERLRLAPHFYRTLPKMPGADRMANLARDLRDRGGYDLMFLTAIPKGNDVPWAFHDKMLWAQEFFPDIPVHFGPYSTDKWQHCTPGDILVDDRKDNCDSWESADGAAVLVTEDYELALKQLAALVESRIQLGTR
jgi:5'(3')-deoxyribonucleotidase